MHEARASHIVKACPRERHPGPMMTCLLLLVLVLTLQGLWSKLPPAQWTRALFAPDTTDIRQMVIHYSWLPRLVLSCLCGAALALAGVIFQQVLRNPLAEPMTTGVSAGSYLALLLATLWAPAWLLA